jgi:hypothetical protein
VVDVILAVLAVAVIVTLAVAALLGLTAAPLLVAMAHAERLGGSPARAGVAAALGASLGLGLATWLARHGATPPTAALPLLLTWVVPVVVARSPRRAGWVGRAGRHERLLR